MLQQVTDQQLDIDLEECPGVRAVRHLRAGRRPPVAADVLEQHRQVLLGLHQALRHARGPLVSGATGRGHRATADTSSPGGRTADLQLRRALPADPAASGPPALR